MRLNIKTIEQYTGIKSHTIRIWEQRYAGFDPGRTASNRREYNLSDLRRFLDLGVLTRYGFQISRLSAMDPGDIKRHLSQLEYTVAAPEIAVNKLLIHYREANITAFEKVMGDYLQKKGTHALISDIIMPFIEKAGLFSYNDDSPGGHFIINSIRRKLVAAIDQTHNVDGAARVLLFLPAGQHYDIILLYNFYQLARSGIHVFYMGSNVSLQSLESAARQCDPGFLITYLVPDARVPIESLVNLSLDHVGQKGLIITTSRQFKKLKHVDIQLLCHYEELTQRIISTNMQLQ